MLQGFPGFISRTCTRDLLGLIRLSCLDHFDNILSDQILFRLFALAFWQCAGRAKARDPRGQEALGRPWPGCVRQRISGLRDGFLSFRFKSHDSDFDPGSKCSLQDMTTRRVIVLVLARSSAFGMFNAHRDSCCPKATFNYQNLSVGCL